MHFPSPDSTKTVVVPYGYHKPGASIESTSGRFDVEDLMKNGNRYTQVKVKTGQSTSDGPQQICELEFVADPAGSIQQGWIQSQANLRPLNQKTTILCRSLDYPWCMGVFCQYDEKQSVITRLGFIWQKG